jgi:hypothetical protein
MGSGTQEKERHLESVDGEPVDAEEELAREADARGMSVEDLAEEREKELEDREGPDGDAERIPPGQIPIPGTIESISGAAGGAKPTSSELRIMGGRRPVEGQYSKGDVIRVECEVKVGAVEFIDTTDEWGTVQSTVRVQKGRLLTMRVLSS